MHGKVKLARDLTTGENVAIKIVPRFSKRRRLGRVTAMSTQDKSKKEIAILKKIRHPNIVALLEIIDDPELRKIYLVLEHVELGEIVWRKKGLPHICLYERRRVEREVLGQTPTPEEEAYDRVLEHRQAIKDMKRAKSSQRQVNSGYWSLEHGATDEDDVDSQGRSLPRDDAAFAPRSFPSHASAGPTSRATSRAPSRNQSSKSLSRSGTPQLLESENPSFPDEEDLETPVPFPSSMPSTAALDGTMYGPYLDDAASRQRSPSMAESLADSIISHMSSVDFHRLLEFNDDFSYVPCFTMEQARLTFRDTVLGLEYLHYEGVVHRDIKPANLLWTKEHRVKISDFGVSYFGRPIRDGEPDEAVSESEAKDFDNDLELAKTVGTPAFFAPELCYTDSLAGTQVQPKVTEQIDVWSLGVTLYCLIFARIPFLAEDEWHLFRKIATEDVFIPKQRLRPVDPATKPDESSLYTRINPLPYRNDDELLYEKIDVELHDLLTQMLRKNPVERIRLREVKRHPWVLRGIQNVVGWVDDTDPSRFTAGRKIQVNKEEMAGAVSQITLLERAKSVMKKTIGKVMPHRADRADVQSRRRAVSSAASSGSNAVSLAGSATPHPRDARKKSLRPDDHFASLFTQQESSQQNSEHPLSQSVTASPSHTPPIKELLHPAFEEMTASVGGLSTLHVANTAGDFDANKVADRPAAAPTEGTTSIRHTHSRYLMSAFSGLSPTLREPHTVPATPTTGGPVIEPSSALSKARDITPSIDESSRVQSVDGGLFANSDKRAKAQVSVSTAMAPGKIDIPHRSTTPSNITKAFDSVKVQSPRFAAPQTSLAGYQHGQPKSDPNMHDKQRVPVDLEERPKTAHRIQEWPDAVTPPPRVYDSSARESFARAQDHMHRRRAREREEGNRQTFQKTAVDHVATVDIDPARVPCPPSPDEDLYTARTAPLSRDGTQVTGLSSSSVSVVGGTMTPLTSPSVTGDTPAVAASTGGTSDAILTFQSDPSLPALLSGASSISADAEGDFLENPGVVPKGSIMKTADSADSTTPPALAKESTAGFPLGTAEQVAQGAVAIEIDEAFPVSMASSPPRSAHSSCSYDDEDEDSGTDSDGGLVIKPRKKGSSAKDKTGFAGPGSMTKRRDTNASTGSTDTAKKVVMD